MPSDRGIFFHEVLLLLQFVTVGAGIIPAGIEDQGVPGGHWMPSHVSFFPRYWRRRTRRGSWRGHRPGSWSWSGRTPCWRLTRRGRKLSRLADICDPEGRLMNRHNRESREMVRTSAGGQAGYSGIPDQKTRRIS